MNTTTAPLPWSDGVTAFVNGIRFILTTPRSWPYAAVPAVIMLVLSIVFTVPAVLGAAELSHWVFGEERTTWGSIGYWLAVVGLSLMGLLLGAVLALALAQPLSGFALEGIVRLREQALTGRFSQGPSFVRSLWLGGRVALVTVAVGLVLFVLFVVINFFVPPAVVLTIPLDFLICAWLLAWNFHDYPLGLRSMGFRARCNWARRHLGAFSAFGVCWSLVLIVPGIVLLLLPMGVAGATELVVKADSETG